ncbi:hypothetical protein NMG60_11003299 [Bertholletia excelsa]
MSYRLPPSNPQSLTLPEPHKLADDHPLTSKTAQSTVTAVYLTHIGGHSRNVTVLWSRNLMNHSLTIYIDSEEHNNSYCSCKIDLKPWYFWSKKGYKTTEIDGVQVEIYWDLRSAKFTGGPEPCSDFYVAVVSDEEVALLLGDYGKKAYKRTKSRPALVEPLLFYKKENVFSKKIFSTRARFEQGSTKEHEIVVEILTSGPQDPEMRITVDGFVVIHVRNLPWKFRGNETVQVNEKPVHVFWDVHAWLFSAPGSGHATFIFKPDVSDPINDKGGCDCDGDSEECNSTRSQYYSPQSHESQFCLFLCAWKLE